MDDPYSLHLELSTKCPLACPDCPRTDHIDKLRVQDMSLSVIESIVRDENLIFSNILLCGDHGDPIYHAQFHDVLRLLKKKARGFPITIATNGCYRTESWWVTTAQILEEQDSIIFGIDGLEDTSRRHRVNSDWNSAIQAMKTVKRAGSCKVIWQWILLNFNQSQLKEARKIFRALDIDSFLIVESHREHCTKSFKPSLTLEEAYDIFRE